MVGCAASDPCHGFPLQFRIVFPEPIMRACVQRVTRAEVTVAGESVGRIGPGLAVLLGVGKEDQDRDAVWMADKLVGLRIFEDEEGRMNRSVAEAGGEVLVVSQFTLWGDCRRGKRPSFTDAAPPERANELYEQTCGHLRERGVNVATGRFRAHMEVSLVNDGPVTILLDSQGLF
jgi:D-tyrosyl-tRNA(Tyr) deacylase